MGTENMVRHTNYRVEVHPHESKDDRECIQLQEEIERKVDDFDFTEIISDTVCATCGGLWETPPYCCETAALQWAQEHPEWSRDERGCWRFY